MRKRAAEMARPVSTLGRNLLRLRESRGLTQHQLAEASGVSRPTIARLENGRDRGVVQSTTMSKLAAALGVSLDEIQGVQRAPIAGAIDEYLRLYQEIDEPTDDELDKLSELGLSVSRGVGLSPKILHKLLEILRESDQDKQRR